MGIGLWGSPFRKRPRSYQRSGAKTHGSRSGQTLQRRVDEPSASRRALTAHRADSLAPSIVARSVFVRT